MAPGAMHALGACLFLLQVVVPALAETTVPMQLMTAAGKRCLNVDGKGSLQLKPCADSDPAQLFVILASGCIKNPSQGACFVKTSLLHLQMVTTTPCSDACEKFQVENPGRVKHEGTGLCLVETSAEGVFMETCSDSRSQQWQGLNCGEVLAKLGRWQPTFYSNGHQTLSFKWGMERQYTQTDTVTWGKSVEISMETGFDVEGIASAKVSVSGSASQEQSREFSDTFTMSEEESWSTTFDTAGQVWQWEFDITDGCGASVAKCKTAVITPSRSQPPCCLPGFAEDPERQNGPCSKSADGRAYVLKGDGCSASGLSAVANTTAPIII